MHCVKTINFNHEYGTTRLCLLSGLTFVCVFSFSYVLSSLFYDGWHSDDFLGVFFIVLFLVYPLHKGIHYVSLFGYRKSLSFRFKIQFYFIPVLSMRITNIIPKRRYTISLIAPFIILNSVFLAGSIFLPFYGHYFCLLLAFHTSMCMLDLLNIKVISSAPKGALIEETPRGYEILVP